MGLTWTAVFRLAFFLLLAATAFVYVRGWRRLQEARPPGTPDSSMARRSLFSFMAGLTLLALVVTSPLADYSLRYFSARSLQHMLLVASIPALLVMANPVPALLLGLPDTWRERVLASRHQGPLASGQPASNFFRWATSPGVTLLAFLCICWFWYDPTIHQATLSLGWVHAIEMMTLLGIALLNWWHISGSWPRPYGLMPPVVRIFYTTISIWPLKIVGLILLFIPTTFYAYPDTWRFSGLNINDYMFGAMLTWIVGGLAYVITAVLLAREWLGEEEVKPVLPPSAWDTNEKMIAPGIDP